MIMNLFIIVLSLLEASAKTTTSYSAPLALSYPLEIALENNRTFDLEKHLFHGLDLSASFTTWDSRSGQLQGLTPISDQFDSNILAKTTLISTVTKTFIL